MERQITCPPGKKVLGGGVTPNDSLMLIEGAPLKRGIHGLTPDGADWRGEVYNGLLDERHVSIIAVCATVD